VPGEGRRSEEGVKADSFGLEARRASIQTGRRRPITEQRNQVHSGEGPYSPDWKTHGSGGHISATDTGLGIRREEQEAIFETFHRHLRPDYDVCQGTGLGLSITKLLVEKHGGKIWVESGPNQGSKFHVTLPSAREQVQ
jgi:signal transduction histidine kinase